MKKKRDSGICKRGHFLLFGCVISVNTLFAQQTQITDYVIFGGKTASGQTAPVSPGYSAQIGSSCNIQGGITGSYNLVKSTGNLSISGNIYSGGIIQLANSNIVTGRLSAASSSGKVISVGSSANIGGNIDANGNIVVGGGNVTGTVTHPSGTTYTGPVPGGGNIIGIPNLPILPNMPIINVFAAASSTNISNTQTITPGSYGNVTLGGNKTLTLSGTGIYVFNSIKNSGTANNFVFDFKNDPTGQIKIYVWGDVDLNKVKTSILNGGNETRIYLETHGSGSTSSNGTVAFNIANGSAGQASKWVGSVWAPYAAINIGSGTGSTNLTGALWSGTQVNLQSGISMIFAPFIFCTPPTANAGANQSTCSNIGTASITGASATNQTGVSWSTSGTGTFANGNTLTPIYTPSAADISAGTVTLTLTAIGNAPCGNATSTKTLTIFKAPTVAAGADQSTCSNSGPVSITGASATNQTGVNWSTSGTGTFTSGNTLTPTYIPGAADISAGSVTLTLTATGNAPCANTTSTKTITIVKAPTANAGANQSTCSNSGPVSITGASATNQTGVSWTTSGTGTFTNGNTLTPTYTPSATDISAGSVALTLAATGNTPCASATSTKILMINAAPIANAGPDKAIDVTSQATLTGTTSTTSASYNWQAINGGVISSATNQATITVLSAGTYIFTVTAPSGCVQSDTAMVTSKLNNVIGSELQSIYDTYNPNAPDTSSPFFLISADGYVTIDIIVKSGYYDSVLNLLRTAPYGLIDTITNGASSFIITGKFPIINLSKLNLLGDIINYCRPYYQPFNNIGLVTSAGDTTMRSNLVRSGYKIDGTGVKIGVISNSFATIGSGTTATLPLQPVTNPPNPTPQTFTTNTAAQDTSNGDLPDNVHVLEDYPIQRSDEGRAMLQIIHDVAPGAELYFRTGFFSAGDFAAGIKELKDSGCNVIVDDVTFMTEPFLKDGVVARTVDTVTSQGVSYFSAAGNFANRSYEKNFNPVDATSIGFPGKKAHDFSGTGDMFQKVRLAPGNYTFVFQWVDDIYSVGETGGTKNDMDIYLTKNTDGTGLIGYNRDNTNGDPIEFIPITITGTDSVDYNILIVNNTTTSNPSRIKYIVFSGGIRIMEYNEGNSTLVGQANAAGAIAVGAARFDKAPPFLNPPLIESFSSLGGTMTNGVIRQKPDLVAPDGVNTTVKLGQDYPNSALDGYSNFFGTSAAAPHAAAVAALLMQGRKKFLNQPVTLPDTIRSLLTRTATDMATPGFDFISGYGLINADSAMRTFAAPTPVIDSLIVPATSPLTIPGDTVFTVTVKGENFSNNSQIYFKDSALASTQVINTNKATAVIPKFDGNPAISVYTPPYTTTNGLDGGFSNSLYFFQANITVSADSITKKYGEQLRTLDTTIRINGILLQDTTLTLTDIGLTKLTLTTAATTNSDVGTYIITPSGNFDESNPTDSAFLVKYHYKFVPGIVTINKMPLKVTPNDQTINYGQYVGNVTFKYDYDRTNIPNPVALDSLIKIYHQSYLPNNALAVVKDFSKPQSDGSVLTTADLLNMNMIASFKAVNNSRKFQLGNNNQLIPLSNQTTFNAQYLVDVASESIFNYKKDPTKAKFFRVYPGINSKALLGATALTNNTGQVEVNGSLVQMVNGSLVQMVNGTTGSIVPIVNGSLVQIVNGQLSPVPNGSLVQMVNGSLVQLVNGEFVPIPNGSLVQLVNGSLVQMVNGSLVQIVNGQQVPIINGSLVQLVNGSLVQMVNGVPTPIPNGSLVQMVNGSLVQMVNGSLQQLVNGSLQQLVNGSLVQLVNGSLVQLVNSNTIGADAANNNTAVILDTTDVDLQTNWIGPMFGINMVTGLNAGQQSLIPGVLVNPNFDITYGLGTVAIKPDTITVTAKDTTRQYGNSNPAFSVTYSGFAPGDSLQNSITGVPSFTTNVTTTSAVGSYLITPTIGTLASPNYVFKFVNGTLTITRDTITVKADSISRQYGNANPPLTVAYSGFVAGDSFQNSVTGVPSLSTTATQTSPVGDYPITVSIGTLASTNYVFNLVNRTLTIFKDTITVKAKDITRQYGDNNPTLTVTYSGFAAGDNLQTSVTGVPILNTTATPTSPVGTYPITVSNGTLASSNYAFRLLNGVLTITNNPCVITHSTFKNFGNTTVAPTSLWMNMTTKIRGQLSANGDYLLFKAGTITFNNISSSPLVNNLAIPAGKIVADNTISSPVTSFDAANSIWITKVPLGFSSTSDIFITGAIINSSNGFVKSNGNTSSDLNGIFLSNKNFSDQWAYAIAAYQPQFTYASLAAPGQVASINGTYRAGTPIPEIPYLVNGGSSGGGNNYTGSSSSYDNYTACTVSGSSPITGGRANNSLVVQNETQNTPVAGEVKIIPNPASDYINLTFVPVRTGNSKTVIYSIDGRKVYEMDNGVCEAGINYLKRIDVSKFITGMYIVQLWTADKIVTKKIIISR